MVDYGPGDEIVSLYDVRSSNIDENSRLKYRKNEIYTCTYVGPSSHPYAKIYYCKFCDVRMDDAICVHTTISTIDACSCYFRKKLDFKKLCNVDETTKIKEDA